MASTVTNFSSLINPKYPVSGADNNLSGFHTNFLNIQESLNVLGDEITRLQENGVYLYDDNDFDNNTVTNAVITNSVIILKGV